NKKIFDNARQVVVIIDEVVALHDVVLDSLSSAIASVMPSSSSLPFGGVPVILSGDPCQIGRVELYDKSPAYPPTEYPTGPCWKADSWRAMRPVVMYLTSFHRGQDSPYLKLLAEIRSAPRIRAGLPQFSESSMKILNTIRDRDGGARPPRFPHTTIRLTNRQADEYNKQHLEALPGEEYTVRATDTVCRPLGSSFSFADVDAMGFKSTIQLKKGCRVMASVNDPAKRFTNGMLGEVVDIMFYGEEPVVKVRFDGEGTVVSLRRQRFDVHGPTGDVLFTRDQIPLTLCAAVTAHKIVGATLQGVWVQLPFKGVPPEQDNRISDYWSAPWLAENCTDPSLLQPIFFMDPEAADFDALCRMQNWLAYEEPVMPEPIQRNGLNTNSVPPSDHENYLARDHFLQVENKIEQLGTVVEDRIQLLALTLHFSSLRGSCQKQFTNPVVYCMMRPTVFQKISQTPMATQTKFYQSLHECLNLTHDEFDEERLEQLIQESVREQAPSRSSLEPQPCEQPPQETRLPVSPEPHLEANGVDVEEHSYAGTDETDEQAVPQDNLVEEAAQEEDSDEEDDAVSLHEELPVGPPPGPANDKYGMDPFVIYKGHIYPVLKRYLGKNPHFRVKGMTVQHLKYGRRQCVLECERSISTRIEGKVPTQRARPDWRLWPEHVCQCREVYVKMIDGRCYFYPLRTVPATLQEWRDHQHLYGTETCRSSYVPPDVCDHWAEELHRRPDSTLKELREKSDERYLAAKYLPSTLQFIAEKGLQKFSKVQGAYRSLVENGKGSLSVDMFVRQIESLRYVPSQLKETFSSVVDSLTRVGTSLQTDGDLEMVVREGEKCILLDDVLCEKLPKEDGKLELHHFAAVFTSARMLSNLKNCKTVGLDGTYNIIYGEMVILVVCALPYGEVAKPVGIVLLKSESASSVSFALRKLTQAAEALDITEAVPEEVVMDGSDALHNAVKEVWGNARIISCYYHAKQRAKKAKATPRLPSNIWKAVNRDLDLMGAAWSRRDWVRLRDLFVRKWTPDEGKSYHWGKIWARKSA
ncbi:hypothetical protein FOL47_000897, partial [Perkinsus chesapeaki]